MALQTALELIENPNPKFIEAVEETARLAVSGTGWTLSLYPAAAVAAFLGIFTIAPLFSKITKICFVLKINMHSNSQWSIWQRPRYTYNRTRFINVLLPLLNFMLCIFTNYYGSFFFVIVETTTLLIGVVKHILHVK